MVPRVGNGDLVLGVDGQIPGIIELTHRSPLLSEFVLERPVGSEYLLTIHTRISTLVTLRKNYKQFTLEILVLTISHLIYRRGFHLLSVLRAPITSSGTRAQIRVAFLLGPFPACPLA